MPNIGRYLNIRSAYGPAFSYDGASLSFLMDTTGVPQVWTVTEPGAWPEQQTFYDERITFTAASPAKRELVFGMDEGGDERQQFYRYIERDGSIVPLTDAPAAKHRWGGWNSDGSRFAFASNRRDDAVFDIYTQGRDEDGMDASLIYKGDGWLTVGGWSPDDSRLVIHESYSNYDQDVYVLDLTSGSLRHVTPHDGDVRYSSVNWAPDGDSLFVTTDEGSDTLYLAKLDLDSLALTSIRTDDEWNIEWMTVQKETGQVAYARNVDGYNDLTTGILKRDGGINEYPKPDLPPGVYGGLDFDTDHNRLAVTVTGRTQNPNVFVLDLPSGTAVRWTNASTAGVSTESFIDPDLIRYESFDGLPIPAFFSMPAHSNGTVPVIVDIHGGPESQRRPSFGAVTQYFLANGYAVFEPNVRGSTGYGKEFTRLDDKRNRIDSVMDVIAGVEWLAEQSAVDTDRIVALGGSYGGFMVLSALTETPDRWAAGIDIVGIANFITFLQNTGDWRRSLREAEYGSLDEDREFLAAISPINNIDAIAAPLLVLHGANDPRVPVEEAEQIAAEAAKHVPVEKIIFEDEGHGFTKLENRIEAYSKIVSFLDTHL